MKDPLSNEVLRHFIDQNNVNKLISADSTEIPKLIKNIVIPSHQDKQQIGLELSDEPMKQFSDLSIKKQLQNARLYGRNNLNEIDRKIAIYYHPLFQEVADLWMKVIFKNGPRVVSFILFVELNIRLQRALLAQFDLSNAYFSAVKDWIKEIGDYRGVSEDAPETSINENMLNLQFTPAISQQDYLRFYDQQRGKEIFNVIIAQVSGDVIVKFLFDLCMSWCQNLDIELHSYFLLALLLQITQGNSFEEATILNLYDCELLPNEFLEDFQSRVDAYNQQRRKALSYYRKWCEWNYLRLEQISESLIAKLLEYFQDDQRAESLVGIFTRAVEVVNGEISKQMAQPTNAEEYKLWDEDNTTKYPNYDNQVNFRTQKVQQQVPDEFVISYNENENAFILERKVKIPIIGQKLTIEPHKQHKFQKNSYVYYVSEKPSEEMEAQLIKNLPKPHRLPIIDRKKQIKILVVPDIVKPKSRGVNQSFSHASQAPINHSTMQPDFLNQTNLYAEVPSPSHMTYKTSKKTWEYFSSDIGTQHRIIKSDIPKEIQARDFLPNEFNKFVVQREKKLNLGRINKSVVSVIPVGVVPQQAPLENERIANIMRNEPATSEEQIYGLHNVQLTFKQWESLEQNRHLWGQVLSWDEVQVLRQDDNKFYHILQLLKLKFNEENKSLYLKQLHLDFNYASRRDEMGGIISSFDQEKFHQRIRKLIERDRRRRERRKNKRRALSSLNRYDKITTHFKNRQTRKDFRQMFIMPLKKQFNL